MNITSSCAPITVRTPRGSSTIRSGISTAAMSHESHMVVPFSMLLNLASVSGAEDKDQLWGFIQRYAPEASPETNPDMDQAAGFAVRYYNDFVKPAKTYRLPTDLERAALEDLRAQLKAH